MPGTPSTTLGSRLPTHPLALWGAFALVHGLIILFAFLGPGVPLGDVTFMYPVWMKPAFESGYVVGIDGPWVYPVLALVPLAIAGIAGFGLYGAMWLLMVIVLDAVAFGVLIGWGHRPARRHRAAWWWLAFLLLLGPIALTRVDSVATAIAIVALLFAAGRPRLASALLSIATWIKVWPAALIAALIVASRRRVDVLVAALGTSVAVVAVVFVLGGGANLLSFVGDQTTRALQIEAPISTPWIWAAAAGGGARIVYDHGLNTFEVEGAGAQAAAGLMTPLLFVALAGVLALGARAAVRRAHFVVLFPPLAIALVMALIVFNKVGSPQYMCWIAAPVILGVAYRGRRFMLPAVLALVLAALTQAIYPFLYDALLRAHPLVVALLTLRNLAEVALLAWAALALWRSASVPAGLRSGGVRWKTESRPRQGATD
ncbi:glycosyltransferase 87 family protein [Rathayibacter sp. YIM 133350]|uniref:glycosyltransferase 87 family protein n=1 Tax=Rathayibacter sp. YIM 133350 TaxID=3131992 RepID=UPI00307FB3B4